MRRCRGVRFRSPAQKRLATVVALGGLLVPGVQLCGCSQQESPANSRPQISVQDFKRAIKQAGLFTGGVGKVFEDVGRQTLAKSISVGLMPDDVVLDIGAGSLRIGWWLLQYIEPANYYAVEPVQKRIDAAAEILGVDIKVFYNDDWEFPDAAFDFVIARSIWTHASKWMIAKMLAEFAENSSADGRFLVSALLANSEAEDYMGTEWVGKVEKSDRAGLVRHSFDWIRTECGQNGLQVQITGELNHQTWLLITPAP
jgi:hypothetical protein